MTSHNFSVKSINIPQFYELNVHILQKKQKKTASLDQRLTANNERPITNNHIVQEVSLRHYMFNPQGKTFVYLKISIASLRKSN